MDLKEAVFAQLEELIRETFEGAKPGEGTAYLDHDSGVRATLSKLTAEQASRSRNGHPSIAAHARHMNFHMRVIAEDIRGEGEKRDWPGSFLPHQVTESEWKELQAELERSRAELLNAHASLAPVQFVEEGAGFGAVAHLAYHLGAIRQLVHDV